MQHSSQNVTGMERKLSIAGGLGLLACGLRHGGVGGAGARVRGPGAGWRGGAGPAGRRSGGGAGARRGGGGRGGGGVPRPPGRGGGGRGGRGGAAGVVTNALAD